MPSFNIKCPFCSVVLEVQDEWAGMETNCPECQNAFIIPQRDSEDASAPAEPPTPPESSTPHLSRKYTLRLSHSDESETQTEINCPGCGRNIEVPLGSSVNGMACPYCQSPLDNETQDSTSPSLDEPVLKANTTMTKNRRSFDSDSKGSNASAYVKPILKIVFFLLLLAAGFFAYWKIMTPTVTSLKGNQLYVMTQKRQNRDGNYGVVEIARHDFFPIVQMKSNFYYRDASFSNISLGSKEPELYEGIVSFTRGNSPKTMTRPVVVDRRGRFTHYRFPFKYAEHPDYLEEDGDLILDLAAKIDRSLEGWKYVSGRAGKKTRNLLICQISKSGETKSVRLKAEQMECDDKIGRIWVEILDEKAKTEGEE